MCWGQVACALPRTALQIQPPSPAGTQHPMPPRRLFSSRGRSAQSPSLPPSDSSPNGASSTPLYPDYLNETAGPGSDAAVAVASIMEDISTIPLALITPLTQVLNVVSGIRVAVKAMRDGKDGCTHLIFRVLKFLQSLVDGLKGRNIPDSTPTASNLSALKRYSH
ncbi:hypothetical protein BS47DRAFT_1344131 [Hydnum rufescens UP504]|uniref:Uncharacterized protein n=1 Tax=Hydnum rufescens UP504 TaxID=1448309 RepID=A0A9P6AX58_9AGAM|nr:hypothetical protein BS47DRAFT_1344131 [Hydnum rufescens UP504]